MYRGFVGAPVARYDAYMNFFGRRHGIADLDVPIAVLIENTRIQKTERGIGAGPPSVFFHKQAVRILRLGVFVEIAKVAVARRGVQVKIIFLHVLALVALVARQPEGALLENGINTVPERESKAQALLLIGDASHAVLVPPVSAGARLVMAEVLPGRAVGAVVFTHRAPRTLGKIRAPKPPVFTASVLSLEARPLGIHP